MKSAFGQLWRDEEGMTTVEYALLVALVVVAGAAGWDRLGQTLINSSDEPIAALETTSSAN